MTHSSGGVLLRFIHEPFAIAKLIGDCPAGTVIWELVRNAFENAVLHPNGPGKIEFFRESWDGTEKLGLYNEGPGMSPTDLERFMDMASTGKTIGEDEHFGQGAKVSGMKASPGGLIYRSCTGAGRAYEIILHMVWDPARDYRVCEKMVRDFDGQREVVVDVSEEMVAKGRDLGANWTEVVLAGKYSEQDTVAALFESTDVKRWLIQSVNRRFWSLPEGVRIDRCNVTTGEEDARHSYGMVRAFEAFVEREEIVSGVHSAFGSVRVRYGKLRGEAMSREARHRSSTLRTYGLGGGGHACLVYKDECFDIQFESWSRKAPAFGFLYGAPDFFVEILLPQGAPVKMDTYRSRLITRGPEAAEITCQVLAALVKEHRPAWVLDYLTRLEDSLPTERSLKDRMRQLMQRLRAPGLPVPEVDLVTGGPDFGAFRERRDTAPPGERIDPEPDPNPNPDPCPPGPRPGPPVPDPLGPLTRRGRGKPTNRFVVEDIDAQFHPLSDEEWYGQMVGKAGEFILDSKLIKLSEQHGCYQDGLEIVRHEYPEDQRDEAVKLWREEYRFHAMAFVAFASLYRDAWGWNPPEWHKGVTPESLTFHLTNPNLITEARRRISAALARGYAEGAPR